MLKKLSLAFLGLLLLGGALVGTKLEQFKAMGEAGAMMTPPPETITAAVARADEWEQTIAATGTLDAVQGIVLRTETRGRIVRIAFDSGAQVEQGEVLVVLDSATEAAQLTAAEATAALAKADLARTRDLHRNKTVSAAQLDAAEARFQEAAAAAETIRTTIAKKTVRAPFSGRLGIRQVDLGAVLAEGDAITTLQTLHPIHVDFSVPQRWLPDLETGTVVRVTTDAAPGHVYEGRINAISPEVDPATRNVRVQATIDNEAERLRAGMFANVEVVLPQRRQVLAIPVTAVLFAPYGDSVFVIQPAASSEEGEPGLTVQQRFVRLGVQRGDFVAVVDGLEPGEEVVSSGVFKLRSGMSVVIDNTLAPDAELAPTPGNT